MTKKFKKIANNLRKKRQESKKNGGKVREKMTKKSKIKPKNGEKWRKKLINNKTKISKKCLEKRKMGKNGEKLRKKYKKSVKKKW